MKVLVAVDSSDSSSRAVREAMRVCSKEEDTIILMHVASGWDYLNDEKNNGRLALDLQRAVLENSGFKHVLVVQKTAEQSPQIDFCEEAEERGVDVFIIGESSFVQPTNPDNYLYWAFSALKRMVVGRMSDYIVANAKCRVVVVPDPPVGIAAEPSLVAVDGAPISSEHRGSESSSTGAPVRSNSIKGQILPGLFVDSPSDEDAPNDDDDPNGDDDVVPFEDSDDPDAVAEEST